MEPTTAGNLLEIIDLARTLRQEQLFIQQEQAAFAQLNDALETNATEITKLAYICAQQRQNLHDLLLSRTDHDPLLCCRRANGYDSVQFIDAKKAMLYEHALAYEDLFNYLYNAPYLLALSLATADRLSLVGQQQLCHVINTITTGLYGNAINTKDVELLLKLLRELIEIQLVGSENPRRLLRANSSAFARLYQRLVESMFSAKIFLTAALHAPLMCVLSEHETLLDLDPHKLVQSFSARERQRRFGAEESSAEYQRNVARFHSETLAKLHAHAKAFVASLQQNWSLFPSSLRWLMQTLCHQLKQAHRYSERQISELIADMVFTHFICPAIVSPDFMGIIDAPVTEQMRHNLNQIVQLIQTLAQGGGVGGGSGVAAVGTVGESNAVAQLIDLLLVGQTGEDVVAILSQQSDFERAQLVTTQRELQHFSQFFRLLTARDEYDISAEERQRLQRILARIPQPVEAPPSTPVISGGSSEKNTPNGKRANKGLMRLGKATKKKLAMSMSFNTGSGSGHQPVEPQVNGNGNGGSPPLTNGRDLEQSSAHSASNSSLSSCDDGGPGGATLAFDNQALDEPVLMFTIYNAAAKNKVKPLTEEEVLKMNCIGQEISNEAAAALLAHTNDKSSTEANGCYDDVSSIDALHRPKNSLSHDDASIGNSDNLEAVSEAAHSNHSVTSSLDLEEQEERDVHDAENDDNLSDMVSANVSGRGTPNISGRDTPSSQVTDGDGGGDLVHHTPRPTPQMQKMLLSKARSDIEDKFCKFELKKFEGDENVSIISDTWSTDVLASDSETTLDAASERERDRNFSTPLIPSAVVLPGDQNFVVEALARGAGGAVVPSGSGVRSYQLDASDQRSESNWSTDVLASDSEKLAEIDTDDNVSITAKSDITDAGVRSETERDALAAAVIAGGAGGAPANDGEHTPGSSGDNASERSKEDSAFFDAVNSYDDAGGGAGGSSVHYQGPSSLARSSVRTSYHALGGDSSFQQYYKCSGAEGGSRKTTPFMGTACMRRQTSAESSISNQSLNLEDAGKPPPKHHHHHHHHHKSVMKKKKHGSNAKPDSSDHRDLIDFSDCSEDKPLRCRSPGLVQQLMDLYAEEQHLGTKSESVEHRRLSMEQRTAIVDGRRNGIMAMRHNGQQAETDESAVNRLVPGLRRHQSLNYENHEIVIGTIAAPAQPPAPQTDDDKQQELLLCAKTQKLQLDGQTGTDSTSSAAATVAKPTKATGAIPKSISFDATADKQPALALGLSPSAAMTRNKRERTPSSASHGGAGDGIFNKLKQGIFKHRRSNKTAAQRLTLEDYGGAGSSSGMRSVSFVPNAASVSFGSDAVFCDNSEDILAKYRRKVSTSSEATNSDSTGNSAGALLASCHRQHIDGVVDGGKLPMANACVAFNSVKQKIRTVLSKTDLHSGDFRQTTYVNASPLKTYLQIQLAQSINLQNVPQISHVAEALRCMAQLDRKQHLQLLQELQHDIQRRQHYLQYLMRYRQNLLLIAEHLEQFEVRLRGEAQTCHRYHMQVFVRIYLTRHQAKIDAFETDFAQLTASDDKIELIEEFIEGLLEELQSGCGQLNGMTDWQSASVRAAIERFLLEHVYQQVMFPNEDADLSRDTVLSAHIGKLQRIIHPAHPALRIAQEFLGEAPWTFAQQQLSYIAAYKTPREKLQCVINCISSIMSLLRMSSSRVPAADDVLPVLIYVVIMANPPYLLSTVEYITCFLGKKLVGEDEFYWTLFGSVVKFIKTMDYLD
ncbi:receptor-mediated endocytosis protein 6 homolog [Scaptodrosophila lebanonensis]|uniref:Receptor-mediated endocytosis protein 6 homolog n=1 Tax=Drosophila lebanonensis TaxID=7225 RepID=A0A6J2TTX5_DROLE|nr:receptor-mediated endocytosis protein 6 homolog [Scaptodrosophila lebanonensis]